MHEWALAEAVILSAKTFSKKNGINKIREIGISLGELQQVDGEVFNFALKEIMNTENLDFKVVVRKKKAVLRCKKCGREWNYDPESMDEMEKESIHFVPEVAHNYIKCPGCGSPDFKIKEGRGVWLDYVRGD